MRIGIDIDNTLTEVQEKLNKAAYTYVVSLGKNLDSYDKFMQDEKNDGTEYAKRFQFNYEELKYFLKDIQENITNNAITPLLVFVLTTFSLFSFIFFPPILILV